MTTADTCARCRFFQDVTYDYQYPENRPADPIGICRRFPPSEGGAKFAWTHKTWWCGEWKENPT